MKKAKFLWAAFVAAFGLTNCSNDSTNSPVDPSSSSWASVEMSSSENGTTSSSKAADPSSSSLWAEVTSSSKAEDPSSESKTEPSSDSKEPESSSSEEDPSSSSEEGPEPLKCPEGTFPVYEEEFIIVESSCGGPLYCEDGHLCKVEHKPSLACAAKEFPLDLEDTLFVPLTEENANGEKMYKFVQNARNYNLNGPLTEGFNVGDINKEMAGISKKWIDDNCITAE